MFQNISESLNMKKKVHQVQLLSKIKTFQIEVLMNLLLLSRSDWFCKLHNVNSLRFEILESRNQLDVCFSFHFLLRVTHLSTVLSRNHKFLENLLKKACLLWSLPFSDNCPSSAFFSLVKVLICSLSNFSSSSSFRRSSLCLADLDSDRLLLGDLPPSASEIRRTQVGLFDGEGGGGVGEVESP